MASAIAAPPDTRGPVAQIVTKNDHYIGRRGHQQRQRQSKHGLEHKTAAPRGRGGRANDGTELPAKKSFFKLFGKDNLVFPNACAITNTQETEVDGVVVLRPAAFSGFDGNDFPEQHPLGLLGLTQGVHIACIGELRVTPRVFFDLGQDGINIVASPAPSIETRTNPVFTRDFRISLYITSRASLNSRRGVLFTKFPSVKMMG